MADLEAAAAGAAAPAVATIRAPVIDQVQLEKNRKTAAGWFPKWPWFYHLRRSPNYGVCKSCFTYKSQLDDRMTKGTFLIVHDGRIRGDAHGTHAKKPAHRANWAKFVAQYGANATLPGDREPTGRLVVGPIAVPVPEPLNITATSTRLIFHRIFRVAFTIVRTYGAASSLETWLDCNEKNGVELGEVRNSHRSKVTFSSITSSIAGLLRLDQMKRLIAAGYFALLGDGSEQGRGEAEAEALAVQYWRKKPGGNRTIVSEYFDLALVDRAESEDLMKHDAKAITACLVLQIFNWPL